MNGNAYWALAAAVAAVFAGAGCSSEPPAKEAQKAVVLDKIQGKAQVLEEPATAIDSAINAEGPSVYIWVGARRYRLFFRKKVDIVHGNQYVVEGIFAQKAIDDIGDPDMGKNGYPLQASCDRVVKMAWSKLAMDEVDADSSTVRERVKRYPARPLFLVTNISPATGDGSADGKKDDDAEKKIPEVDVAADKEKALLVEGTTTLTAPLWEPEGATVQCKVTIGTDGKIADLDTGKQLCESVAWDTFKYQPPMAGGHPVRVKTEVAVKFEPRK